jgi:hypothetical protein
MDLFAAKITAHTGRDPASTTAGWPRSSERLAALRHGRYLPV